MKTFGYFLPKAVQRYPFFPNPASIYPFFLHFNHVFLIYIKQKVNN